MKIQSMRLRGIRCFEDTGDIKFSPTCTIFVGQNNTGKSTLLRGLLAWQSMAFGQRDIRAGASQAFHELTLIDISNTDFVIHRPRPMPNAQLHLVRMFAGNAPPSTGIAQVVLQNDNGQFQNQRPNHFLVPFLAKRQAMEFAHGVDAATQRPVTGTFQNLYSRIDMLATAGHPRHEMFKKALDDIVGLPITTTASSGGKEAGFYLDTKNFVPLNQMGDGVAEMVGLIVEMCEGKTFVLEEPETNLHPKALKALLAMIRDTKNNNQFVIATHSNIVVRELASDDLVRVYRTFRGSEEVQAPSSVEEVPRTPLAHAELLRELGYEFADLGLFEAWLFLEESSAESVIQTVLIPMFAPSLRGRLRTFAAAGVGDIEPSVHEFQRLMVFLHLEPMYKNKIWIRADNDSRGNAVVQKLRNTFDHLTADRCTVFDRDAFERYYPQQYGDRVESVLSIQDKQERRRAKRELLVDVLRWSRENVEDARTAWRESATNVLQVLASIEKSLP